MKSYSVRKYNQNDYSLWNDFVASAKNATFLFHRDFMEYHSNRFVDYSLLVFDHHKLLALLPANVVHDIVYSHLGLTYGGLLLQRSMGGGEVRDLVSLLLDFFSKDDSIAQFVVNPIPYFYSSIPLNEFEFFISVWGGKVCRQHMNLVIDYSLPLNFHKTKLKNYKKSSVSDLRIEETDGFSNFWDEVLIPRLKNKYDATPVHSKTEITKLKKLFPENIRQYVVKHKGIILAGITIFKTNNVVKSQYGATTVLGEQYRALDYLFMYLIKKFQAEGCSYFDMGSVENDNFGLLKQKEELGCNIYIQNRYSLVIKS